MATEKQIAANRRNAARSTGPRTPLGKKRSSMNALRHGLSYVGFDLPGVANDKLTDETQLATREAAIFDGLATS